MKMIQLVAVIVLTTTVCLAGTETVLLEIVGTTVDMTAAQRCHTVFRSNENTLQTIVIPIQLSTDQTGKNERNIIMLIRPFTHHHPSATKYGKSV